MKDLSGRTIAEALASNIERSRAFTICCPFNVSQIGANGKWAATMPDRSILFCDYENEITHTYKLLDDENSHDFMVNVLDN